MIIFFIGVMIGGLLGLLVGAICAASKISDLEIEIIQQKGKGKRDESNKKICGVL